MRLRRLFAPVAAVLAAVGMTAAPALAADTQVSTADLAKKQTLTVQAASGADISGNTLKAIRLARYSAATTDGTNLTGYDVADTGHAASISTVLKAMTPPPTGLDESNPMSWVVQNLLDSNASPWAGRLRDMVTALAKDATVTGDTTAVTLTPDGANKNVQSATVDPGIYLILDTNATGTASIPMLTGTGINGIGTLKKGDSPAVTLGVIDYKANTGELEKKIVENGTEVDENTASIGDTVTYRLKTVVPNWTGFDKFQMVFSDTLSPGLTFNAITGVTVDGTALDPGLFALNPAKPAPATDGTTTFTVVMSPDAKGVSDVIAHKDKFPVGKQVVVEYTAVVNENAKVNTNAGGVSNDNTAHLEYSHNPNDSTQLDKTPDDTVKTFTGRLKIFKHDATNTGLGGAEFEVTLKGATAPVQFVKKADGEYRVAKTGETGSARVVTKADGTLTVEGLKSGEYTVSEKVSPLGATVLPDFTITLNANDKGKNTLSGFKQDANKMTSFDVAAAPETVDVLNVRSLLQMPQTGAAWLTVYAAAALFLLGGGFMLLRSHKARSDK